MKRTNAVSITVWELSGKIIDPKLVTELEAAAEKVVVQGNLAYTVTTS